MQMHFWICEMDFAMVLILTDNFLWSYRVLILIDRVHDATDLKKWFIFVQKVLVKSRRMPLKLMENCRRCYEGKCLSLFCDIQPMRIWWSGKKCRWDIKAFVESSRCSTAQILIDVENVSSLDCTVKVILSWLWLRCQHSASQSAVIWLNEVCGTVDRSDGSILDCSGIRAQVTRRIRSLVHSGT